MTSDTLFPYRWQDLPDPRPMAARDATTVIEVREPEWRKIVQKHLGSTKEPWSDVLNKAVLDAVISNGTREAIQTALQAIHNEIATSLHRPLVILYSCIGSRVRGIGQRWMLVLPCGALAIIWAEKTTNRLKTCYFRGGLDVKPNMRRWRHVVRQLVQEHLPFDEGTYRYPALNHRREVPTESEMRYAFRFVAADAWGFASNEPGAVWRLPIWNWAESEFLAGTPPTEDVG